MKTILLLCILISLGLQVTVTDADKCSACTDFKSQSDCTNASNGFGCEWKNSACSKIAIVTPDVPLEYCQTLTDPATTCAKTFGCAYSESKCSHFTGCTAYVKTTLTDCQAISYLCITNGITCDDVLECDKYLKQADCEGNPSLTTPYKCKWENDACRDYHCSEADTALNTTPLCAAWKSGCVTTGYGCIDVQPTCNSYTGTSDTCNKMVGKDGKCTLDATSTTTPQACKLRVCSEASLTTWDSTSCGNYKTGCKATGFSCVDSLLGCSSYPGTATTCLNFIGSDGQCAADTAATQCRARKCEDKVSGVLTDCTTYLPGCKTNGVTCVTTLQNCNQYKGTITSCAKIVGADGNCKGTSATDSTVACALKDCVTDAGTAKTDTDCKKIQSFCLGTGLGCVQTRSSCTTYTDDGNCQNYIGLEGKCKTGAGGATPKCAARACTDDTTSTSNTVCQNYLSGCVTNGAGCVQEANCVDTVSKLTCTGTTNKQSCAWTEGCVAKDCTAFSSNQSLCSNTQLSDTQPCIWKINACYDAVCGDFTETEDGKCNTHMSGCVTNGTKCANPANCGEFQGNMTTCRAFTKAKCTNTDDTVAATTLCIDRACTDISITATQDSDCDNYLTGCLLSGDSTKKCIGNDQDCTKFYGGSTGDCSKFTGYNSATKKRDTCWWTSGANCVTKTCDLATGTNNTDCGGFMTGCVYDGDSSCVDETSECTSFKLKSGASQCLTVTGKKTTQKCFNGTSNKCKVRECADAVDSVATPYKTNKQCEDFLSGCLSTGAGCIAPEETCDKYTGTGTTCATFIGNSIPCLRTQKCDSPTITCTGKKDATTTSQCQAYKNTCVLTFGQNVCQDMQANCTGYTLSATDDKSTYCNQVLKTGGTKCAYDSTVTGTCSERACHLWTISVGETCTDYEGANACTIGLSQQCFKLGACTTYTVPTALNAADKITFCKNQWNTTGGTCVYDGSSATCKAITTCEEVISPTHQDDCYDQSGQSNCVLINNACVTIKTACTGYNISGISGTNAETDKATLCSKLKSKSGTTFTLCKYDGVTTGTCVNATCEDISSPSKQSDCSIVSSTNCHYYSSKCYTITSCTSYTVDTITGDDNKSKFCQNMYNTGGTEFCSYDSSAATTCSAPKVCSDYTLTSATDCQKKRDKTGVICTFVTDESNCSIPTVSGENCTLLATGIAADSDCDVLTTPHACKISGSACAVSVACGSVTKTSLTDCQAARDPNGYYCTFVQGGTTCSDGKSACTDWTGAQTSDCTSKKDKYGNTCEWVTGNSTCTNATTCEDAASPTSQADCDVLSSGCIFYNSKCLTNAAACTSYDVSSGFADAAAKSTYCNGRVNSAGGLCTYSASTTNSCATAAACSTYATTGAAFANKLTYCQTLLTTDNYDCTFASGANCMEVADLCTSYIVAAQGDCTSLKDTLGRSCLGTSTTCSYPKCEDIAGAAKQSDCDLKAPGCTYSSNKCVKPTATVTCGSITAPGSGSIAFCNTQKDNNGNFCNAANDTAVLCKDRACNDPAAQYFTTHADCQNYSSNCKSDGLGCIDKSTTCANQGGDVSQCSWLLEFDGVNKCVVPTTLVAVSAACEPKTCEMNVMATTQTDCDNYIPSGNCKLKNPGCFSESVTCENYRGTAAVCEGLVGNKIKCFGGSNGFCKTRVCTDKATAADDTECGNFLTDCVFGGVGCIHKSSTCSQFKGTIAGCKAFIAENGTKKCWSTSTTCMDRTCAQLASSSDADCKAHYDDNCISDGTNCVEGPKNCAYFKGNDDSCSKFTATDGPCKASSVSATPVSCTSRVCYEAPNTYTTDAQCQNYHSSCETNGRGCQATVLCGDYQNKTACSSNSGCLWATSCKISYTTCSSLTSSGQTACVNNPGAKCAWFSGNGGTPACRDYQCADYDATLTTHDACQKASKNACTTTGAGCVDFSTCSTYKSASICGFATTTETSKKCTWDNATAKCRPQQCIDLKGTTNDECTNQLSGCKTNGSTCIGPNYTCSDFQSQKYCLIDSNGQPCLYVDGMCYAYDNCTDATQSTRANCAAFSSNCVQGTSTCIALNQCSLYKDQVSCYSGVSKTVCGWKPGTPDSCAEFKQCGDAAGTTLEVCKAWNSSCVSDGTACVAIGECASYLKQKSCENNFDTASNPCFWVDASQQCRLKQCSDVTATTDGDCLANVVKEGSCTTDGTKCVVRAACTSYAQAGCTIGSDAIPCFYGYAVGQTTGNQSCRAQECTDILGTTNDQCIGKINKKPCVSNGKNCVAQGTCVSYKNKLSCQAGGSDNSKCVFTAAATTADPLAGTCVAFTSCANANGDKATCISNASCKYTDTTNTCSTTDCATFNGSGKCNPFPSFDGKTLTLCVSSTNGCAASDPSGIAQTDCWTTTGYTYTWNASTNKCSSCKGSTSSNNSSNGNTTTNDTTTDSGYVLGASVVLALLGFMA